MPSQGMALVLSLQSLRTVMGLMRPNWGVQVKATAGDTHLGGEDFDNRMVKHFTQVRRAPCFAASAGAPKN